MQLEDVLRVCQSSRSLSAAGRMLFDRSRERKKMANDADRLRKYLARFDLEWGELKATIGTAVRGPLDTTIILILVSPLCLGRNLLPTSTISCP